MDRDDEIRFQVRELLAHRTGYRVMVDDDRPLGAAGVGLDSVALVELLLVCEERFGLPLREELLYEDLTPRALAQAVVSAMRGEQG